MDNGRQVPWIERPALHLDLGLPPTQRYAAVPPEAVQAGRLVGHAAISW